MSAVTLQVPYMCCRTERACCCRTVLNHSSSACHVQRKLEAEKAQRVADISRTTHTHANLLADANQRIKHLEVNRPMPAFVLSPCSARLPAMLCTMHARRTQMPRLPLAFAAHLSVGTSLKLSTCPSAQADVAAKEAAIALLNDKLADAHSAAEGAHASAAQTAAKVEMLTAAGDNLHNDISGLTSERVQSAARSRP